MHFVLFVWLLTALDLTSAAPAAQDNTFSLDESDPLAGGTITIASNSGLGGGETNADVIGLGSDSNNLNVGSTDPTLDGYLTGSTTSSPDLFSLDDQSVSLAPGSCSAENDQPGTVLQARAHESCIVKPEIKLPLDLFGSPTDTLRRLYRDFMKPVEDDKPPVVPAAGNLPRCPIPPYTTRCCTDQLGEWENPLGLLYFVLPTDCLARTLSAPTQREISMNISIT